MRRSTSILAALVATAVVATVACDDEGARRGTNPGDGPMGPGGGGAVLTSVAPIGANVDIGASVEIGFSHAMHEESAEWAAVHVGGPTGPVVDGTWRWADDHAHLAFHPASPWMPGVEYAIHLGGGMHDVLGHPLDFKSHGFGMGGVWASSSMMGGGPMMGPGWRHANGSWGMVFRFTTRS